MQKERKKFLTCQCASRYPVVAEHLTWYKDKLKVQLLQQITNGKYRLVDIQLVKWVSYISMCITTMNGSTTISV